jgi:glutamate racemase
MDKAIGIFDSGVGGLTIVKEIQRFLPAERLVYFGDTARVPYGGKSPETIIRYSIESVSFLMKHSIKVLVIACNTVASHALVTLDKKFTLPIIDVIHPAAKIATQLTKSQHIAVIGTKATIRSEIYRKKIQEILPLAMVTEIPCPLFVPLIEEDFVDHPATRMIVKEYLKPIRNSTIDTLILGCTHYPFLSQIIRKEIGDKLHILDSAKACAEKLSQKLSEEKLLVNSTKQGSATFFVSEDPLKFRQFGEKFLGRTLEKVEFIPTV